MCASTSFGSMREAERKMGLTDADLDLAIALHQKVMDSMTKKQRDGELVEAMVLAVAMIPRLVLEIRLLQSAQALRRMDERAATAKAEGRS